MKSSWPMTVVDCVALAVVVLFREVACCVVVDFKVVCDVGAIGDVASVGIGVGNGVGLFVGIGGFGVGGRAAVLRQRDDAAFFKKNYCKLEQSTC